jgi:murein DD-endopeptidase MepM/ murein hydrolase activator NlpD
LISRRKLYKYNNRTLQYQEENIPFRKKFANFLKFFAIASIMAGAISIVFIVLIGSPIEVALNLKTNTIKSNFQQINSKIDSLQLALQHEIFVTDKYYRELLELDSLPFPVRFGGFGGSNPYDTIQTLHYKEIISTTLRKVDVLKSQLEIQEKSSLFVMKNAVIHNAELAFIPAIQPIKPSSNTWISSSYGTRIDPFTKRRKGHHGLDFAGPQKTEIYSTADGIVTNTKESRRGYGKEIVISHKFGYKTRYAHLNDILVSEGDTIVRGQLIGLMGNTGRSTGTHLHYEVRLNNRPLNPKYYFADDLSVKEYELITKLNHKDE